MSNITVHTEHDFPLSTLTDIEYNNACRDAARKALAAQVDKAIPVRATHVTDYYQADIGKGDINHLYVWEFETLPE